MKKNPSEVIKAMFKTGHNYVLCHVSKTENGNTIHSKDIIHTWDDYNENMWYGCNGTYENAIPFDRKTGRTIVDFVNGKIVLGINDEMTDEKIIQTKSDSNLLIAIQSLKEISNTISEREKYINFNAGLYPLYLEEAHTRIKAIGEV